MEENFNVGGNGASFKACNNCMALFELHVHGRGVSW